MTLSRNLKQAIGFLAGVGLVGIFLLIFLYVIVPPISRFAERIDIPGCGVGPR